jgi:hypothetical protein
VTGPATGLRADGPHRASTTLPHLPSTEHHLVIRSTKMSLIHEDLARAHLSARLGEAHELRRGHALTRVRRLNRRAERATQQARLALTRSL